MKPSNCDRSLDVRGLRPPEPMEQILNALAGLPDRRYLRVMMDREPFPLYGVLDQRGFRHDIERLDGAGYELSIWQDD